MCETNNEEQKDNVTQEMGILGQQVCPNPIMNNKVIKAIISEYGYELFGMMAVFNYGVIQGKRMERKRRKQSFNSNNTHKMCEV